MKKRMIVFCFFAGVFGSAIGAFLFSSTPLEASSKESSFYELNIFNPSGKRTATLTPLQQGQGSLFLFGANGEISHQMASYGVGAEAGQSLMGLHDPQGALRFLLRLHGPHDSPTVVMKDDSGMDKIVFGLDGQTQKPYFRYMDDQMRMIDLIKQ